MSTSQSTLDHDSLVRHTEKLNARNAWSRERLLDLQRQKLGEILRFAAVASPYYQETLGELVSCNAPLSDFPILTKRLLMANFDRIILYLTCADATSRNT